MAAACSANTLNLALDGSMGFGLILACPPKEGGWAARTRRSEFRASKAVDVSAFKIFWVLSSEHYFQLETCGGSAFWGFSLRWHVVFFLTSLRKRREESAKPHSFHDHRRSLGWTFVVIGSSSCVWMGALLIFDHKRFMRHHHIPSPTQRLGWKISVISSILRLTIAFLERTKSF